jgi:hypothetical protein
MSDELLDKIFIAYNDLTVNVRKDVELLRAMEIENKMKIEALMSKLQTLERQLNENDKPWRLIFVLLAMVAGMLGLKVMDKLP